MSVELRGHFPAAERSGKGQILSNHQNEKTGASTSILKVPKKSTELFGLYKRKPQYLCSHTNDRDALGHERSSRVAISVWGPELSRPRPEKRHVRRQRWL